VSTGAAVAAAALPSAFLGLYLFRVPVLDGSGAPARKDTPGRPADRDVIGTLPPPEGDKDGLARAADADETEEDPVGMWASLRAARAHEAGEGKQIRALTSSVPPTARRTARRARGDGLRRGDG
jgi:hypothetical protein